ncbi:high-affinity methionine permease [[Candida] anglica]
MVLQGMIGTGIFATPATILKSIGSIGASYVLWVVGFIIALFEVFVFIEFVMYFKRRSGGEVDYLEQAYPRPKFLVATTYAAVSVILSFSTSSAIAFSSYILAAADYDATPWEKRGVGVAVLTFVCGLSIINSRIALKLSNILGFIKIVFVLFIAITGLVVLGNNTRVKNPTDIFKDSWKGSTSDGNAISSAILKVSFTYGGTGYIIAVAGESDPRKTKNMFRFFLPAVMFSIFILYLLLVTAYYAGINDIKQIKSSGTLIAGSFFDKVFGTKSSRKALNVMVAFSALGHLLAVVVGHSRSLRECGRQGVLPYPQLWTTTKPFGTPVLPLVATYIVNVIVLIAPPPPGDAYNFIVDLGSFSGYIFKLALVVGLLMARHHRKAAGLSYEGFKVPLPILILTILFEIFVIAMAFVPPATGLIGSDVSFFYCTYALTTIGIFIVCILYYYVWAKVLPKIFNYEHRVLYYTLENGEKGHTVVKVPFDQVEDWDATHDSSGKEIEVGDSSSDNIISVDHGTETGKK